MQRITIYDANGDRDGWFDLDRAELIATESKRWNGENMIGLVSGLQIGAADLWRTSGGRWVSHTDRRSEFNGPNEWRFLTDDEARDWIIRSKADSGEELLEQWFPDTPDEVGPGPQGGRPTVGPTISVAYPRELLDRIGKAADQADMSRAAWLRQAAEKAVDAAGV